MQSVLTRIMDSRALVVLTITMISISFHLVNGRAKIGPLGSVVTSIKTERGDIHDCVDIHSQPSLNHPALKDHKIQMQPSKELREMMAQDLETELPDGVQYATLESEGISCPEGSFPVLRVNRQNLSAVRPIVDKGRHSHSSLFAGGLEFAGISTLKSPERQYLGTAARLNIYNLAVTLPHQYSSAVMSLEAGNPPSLSQIQVGWTVNPDLYGDSRTHWYLSWTNDNHQSTGCYNIQCPGFVYLNRQVSLGSYFNTISVYDGVQYVVRFAIRQDPTSQAWYLFINYVQDPVGYWPKEIIGVADTARWGGYVFSLPNDASTPPMGSGHFKNGMYRRTCHVAQITVVNGTQDVIFPDNAYIVQAQSRCYLEGDNSLKSDQLYQYSFLFGGPGGNQC